jgi:hypothetical protein
MAALVRHDTFTSWRAIACARADERAGAAPNSSVINSCAYAFAATGEVAGFSDIVRKITEPTTDKGRFPVPAYVHHVPGRLRLKAAEYKDNPGVLETACRELAALPGVRSVSPNRLTGSILAEYDPLVSAPAALSAAMEERGFPRIALEAPTLASTHQDYLTERFAGVAIRTLFEWFVERLVIGAIAAVI